MDDTLCDYQAQYDLAKKARPEIDYPQSQEGFFLSLQPFDGAVETVNWMLEQPSLTVLLLTAPSVLNPHCYTEKRLWVERYFGIEHCHRLIISAYKGLSIGDYLIDDKTSGFGQEHFQGTLIQFGSTEFSDWVKIRDYFANQLK